MLFSKSSEYAIRALGLMAANRFNQPLGVREISTKTKVPAAYVAKIFQGLTRAGIIVSQRGAKGGYVFRKSPATVTLLQIIDATDDLASSSLTGCVMGLKQCSDSKPCSLHFTWAAGRNKLIEALKSTTIVDVSKTMTSRTFRRERRSTLSRGMRSVFKRS